MILQVVAYVLVGVSALTVVLVQDVLRQAMLFAIFGLSLVALFVVLQAPDVALSELVVSTVAFPLVVLATLAKTKQQREQQDVDE